MFNSKRSGFKSVPSAPLTFSLIFFAFPKHEPSNNKPSQLRAYAPPKLLIVGCCLLLGVPCWTTFCLGPCESVNSNDSSDLNINNGPLLVVPSVKWLCELISQLVGQI